MNKPTQDEIDNWFTYHSPRPGQPEMYARIRALGKALAEGIMADCPPGADRTAAIRKVREAVMTANASIACDSEI